ncbi:MAG: ribonuclease R [Alphaproteobacteria bacterium]|nr:ribonuclease R [Alphaproteobacteria bacterium]
MKTKTENLTREKIEEYILKCSRFPSRRQIAKAFNIKNEQRRMLNSVYKELERKRKTPVPGGRDNAGKAEFRQHVIGIFKTFGRIGSGKIFPITKGNRDVFTVSGKDMGLAKSGQIVKAAVNPKKPKFSRNYSARIIEALGYPDQPNMFSLMSILDKDIPYQFPQSVEHSAASMKLPPHEGRKDLSSMPLVTIDGEDARDFDDAVYAHKTENGFDIVVAIADVACFVRPGNDIDKEAFNRGNSVYFPDRVVSMLPENLSNNLCSLMPGEDRPVIACHLSITGDGRLVAYKFSRAMMRSSARMTYEQVQKIIDSGRDHPLVTPLYQAFKALAHARTKRQTLELDIKERLVTIGKSGQISAVTPRKQLESHQLIEEFMILANVAAAKLLGAKRPIPVMYRVHEAPPDERLQSLGEYLKSIGIAVNTQNMDRKALNRVLEQVKDTAIAQTVNDAVLRTQTQAYYSPVNKQHYGLALEEYAQFTAPIRRYGDLLVHRAIISAMNLGDDGLPARATTQQFTKIAEHISMTERRAAQAERETSNRYVAEYMRKYLMQQLSGVVVGVARFGLFVQIPESLAEGLLPLSGMPGYFVYDEKEKTLASKNKTYKIGDKIKATLIEADPVTGGLVFSLLRQEKGLLFRKKPA